MYKIIGGMLVRNEADRYLQEVLGQFIQICDELVIIDDCSDDDTVSICGQYATIPVIETCTQLWESNEFIQRQRLWESCSNLCESQDWIFILDADEIFVYDEIKKIRQVLQNCAKLKDIFGMRLYDMWDTYNYREDLYWNAHTRLWPFAVRFYKSRDYMWNDNHLHCGRFPKNSFGMPYISEFKIKHMGWATEEDRIKKYERYMRVDPDGRYGVMDQYKSILDKNPRLIKF